MYKVLADAGVWHAGIQLCCRDDPEVIVMANACVIPGTLGRLCAWCRRGEGRESRQALEEALLAAKGPGSKVVTWVCWWMTG